MAKVGIIQYSATPANNTDINSININEGCPAANVNNAMRQEMSDQVLRFGTSNTIASSGTVALGDSASMYVIISGTSTITSFGTPTVANLFQYHVRFSGACPVTAGAKLVISGVTSGVTITVPANSMWDIQCDTTDTWYMSPQGVLTAAQISGLTADSNPDRSADYVATYDASADAIKKVLISALTSGAYRTLAVGGTVVATDGGGTINFTTAGVTLALTAAATLGAGFSVSVYNSAATGVVTIDPNGAETLDGQATRKISPGDRVTIQSDGTNWITKTGEYSFTSADQTITLSSALTIAHGLGVLPKYTNMWLKCTNAAGANGYAQNDLIAISGTTVNIAAGDIFTATDATSLSVIFGGTALAISPKTGGAQVGITTTNYAIVVRAVAN